MPPELPDGADTSAYFADTVVNSTESSLSTTDPTANRLASSGLNVGGINSIMQSLNISFGYGQIETEKDWRVRVSMSPNLHAAMVANSPVMYPLNDTGGVIFPYTPTIQIQHNARYGSTPLTHSNYNSYFYEGSEVQAINISGDFTVQNVTEGQYLLAVIYFFRAATKMFFGTDALAGTPPPMVFLDGYGSHYLPHVPCVVTSFSHTMPGDVDYVEIPVAQAASGGLFQQIFGVGNVAFPTRMPTHSQVSISLQPVYSRRNVYNNFSLSNFAGGVLLGGNGNGGFL
jgi:hypothetical protein